MDRPCEKRYIDSIKVKNNEKGKNTRTRDVGGKISGIDVS